MDEKLEFPPSIPASSGERRPSFSFLRRQKSQEPGAKQPAVLQKKQKPQPLPEPYHMQQAVPDFAPQIPSHNPLPILNSFGGEDNSSSISDPQSFAGYHAMPYPPSIPSSPPAMHHSMRSSSSNLRNEDPYAKTESMTHRGRYSYASTVFSTTGVNSPRRVRKRKDPQAFNILIVGAKSSGKTSFIEFLKYALKLKPKYGHSREKTPSPPTTAVAPDSPFTPHYLETESDTHERLGVTIWDSQGLEKKFVDLQLKEISAFMDQKFEETFNEESKVVRTPGIRDTHVHCAFLILDPSRLDANLAFSKNSAQSAGRFGEPLHLRGILDEDLDIQVLQTLHPRTAVIPVISKADTITTKHMAMLKQQVWNTIKEAKLDPLEALNIAEEIEEEEIDEEDYHTAGSEGNDDSELIERLVDRSSDDDYHTRGGAVQHVHTPPTSPPNRFNGLTVPNQSSPSNRANRLSAAINNSPEDTPYIPMSIISPDSYEPGAIGRSFPWGFADPYNSDHCDFVRLKDSIFNEWRTELRDAAKNVWYESWRSNRLKKRGKSIGGTVSSGTTVPSFVSPSSATRNTPMPRLTQTNSMPKPATAARYDSFRTTSGPMGLAEHRSKSSPGSTLTTNEAEYMATGVNALTVDGAVRNHPSSYVRTAPAPISANRPPTYGNPNGVQMPPPGSPEMVAGNFHHGVNAF